MDIWAIVLAAGQGTRLQIATNGTAKQFVLYDDVPLFWHSIRTLTRCACIRGVILTFPELHLDEQRQAVKNLSQTDGDRLPIRIISGGILRQDSVANALQALPDTCSTVLVHDASRPFFSTKLCHDLVHALQESKDLAGIVPYIPMTDTIKEHDASRILATLPRERLARVQTPQIFLRTALEKAHHHAKEHHIEATDDAALLEAINLPVGLIAGEIHNDKITHPHDLTKLNKPTTYMPCTGFGYDVHRFANINTEYTQPARPMRLGGVPIMGAPDILAHSDGDIVLHALMDALLSLMTAGDIGTHFPDTDNAYDNISSAILLDNVMTRLHATKIKLTHIDITIITQKPKIAPHRLAIQRSCAHLLHMPEHAINVKATSEEYLGFTGEGKGIKVVAIVSALKPAFIHSTTE